MSTTAVRPLPVRPDRTRSRLVLRYAKPAVVLAVFGVFAAVFPTSTIVAGARAFASASWAWLLLGLAAALASMVAFAVLRRRTLAAAGAAVSLRSATWVSFAAGAVHMTVPAGAVFATGYTFRRFRDRGAGAAAVTWSLTVSGILSGLALAGLGLTGLLLHGSGSGEQTAIRAAATGLVTLLVARWVVHSPDKPAALATAVLRRVNRWRHRPVDTGIARLQTIVDDLRHVRPSGRDWTVAGLAAVANWILDLGCLLACATALNVPIDLWVVVTAYALAMGASSLSPLPAGIGVVDSALVVGFTASGAPAVLAIAAVLAYRLLANGSVLLLGWSLLAGRSLHRPIAQLRSRSVSTAPITPSTASTTRLAA